MEKYPLVPGRPVLAAACLALMCASVPAAADTLFGVYAGAGTWQQNFSGDIRSGVTNIDVENDLGLDDDMNNMFYLAVEHFVPLVPNVRAHYTEFNISGENLLDEPIDFNGIIFGPGTDVATDVDITQADAILYYEILDNWVSLDLGVAARYMDGHMELYSDTIASRAEFTAILPLAYGRVRGDLPFSGFWAGAQVMGVGYQDTRLIDANAQIGYESPIGLGAELGWRLLDVDLDDIDDIDEAGIDVSGPYFALNYHF